jgi:hypothetical protein
MQIEPHVAEALRRMAAEQGRSEEELIREALALYTAQALRPLPPGVGKYRSGRSDVSRRARELLRNAAKSGRWR